MHRLFVDLHIEILKYVPPKDLLNNYALLSKQYHKISRTPMIWHYYSSKLGYPVKVNCESEIDGIKYFFDLLNFGFDQTFGNSGEMHFQGTNIVTKLNDYHDVTLAFSKEISCSGLFHFHVQFSDELAVGVTDDAEGLLKTTAWGLNYHPNTWAYFDGRRHRCIQAKGGTAKRFTPRYHDGDTVGMLVNLEEKKVVFYLNGEEVGEASGLPESNLRYFIMLDSEGDTVTVTDRSYDIHFT
eukprot:TRINITY_DN13559_c0_g1_i1.p1 TRINITY_DN13559_c0_g1~~TRINITY_DN13559_c0_g1_i1.p1  ORF type:complete len:240 (+),score=44.09 TRINITY_DN13559_c0_g1_i1:52-771(+)